jgi:NAD-dependent SIR2 family protein deacetylase
VQPSSPESTIPSRGLPVCGGPLAEFIARHPRLFVLTGAGCSTGSGIPDYRDENGEWKRSRPVMYAAFMADAAVRRRYWARSLIGWRWFGRARPNDAHRALARLEALGRLELLVTQNVDGLHQAAGSTGVIDLHGRLDQVRCMQCGNLSPRAHLQDRLLEMNPHWAHLHATEAPDGDADLDAVDFSGFRVPACLLCDGLLKPDVVFYGESVPRERVNASFQSLERADAMLVVGSSLMVYSGFRFAQAAAVAGKPIAAVNLGRTRADGFLSLKISQPCGAALSSALDGAAP